MRIKKAILKDIPLIIEANTQVMASVVPGASWNKDWWIRSEIKNGNFFKIDNKAFMCIERDGDFIDILTLAVRKKYQGRGLGRKLVEYAFKIAKKESFDHVEVGSFIELNAKDFYLKCGFEVIDIGGWGDTKWYNFEYTIE